MHQNIQHFDINIIMAQTKLQLNKNNVDCIL